jgi:O-antigen ligase
LLFARLRDLEWTRQLLIRCLQVTVALAVAFSLIGFVEEATKHLLLSSKLVIENELHEYFTVNSVFFDPNIFGRYLALVMVLLTAVLLYDRRTRVQLASVGALAILWGCLVFTLSRSSLVALGLGMGVLAAAVIVAGGIAIAVRPASFGLSKANGGINGGTSGRGDLITNGIQLFGDRPVYGFGSGSFTPEYASHFRKAAESVSDSHNIPVTVAAEQGIIGELAYLALVITAIIALFRGARGDPFRVGIAAAFLALLLHTLLYAAFLEDPITWTLLAIGGSLAIAARADPRPDGPTRPLRAVA